MNSKVYISPIFIELSLPFIKRCIQAEKFCKCISSILKHCKLGILAWAVLSKNGVQMFLIIPNYITYI